MKKICSILFVLVLLLSACAAKPENTPIQPEPTPEPVISEEPVEPEAPEAPEAPEVSEEPEAPEVPTEPLFTEIDHYVMTEVNRHYLTEQASAAYPGFVDALLYDRPELIEMTSDYDDNLNLWYVFRGSPYYFLIEDYTFTADHTACHVVYAFDAQEQAERIGVIDEEYTALLNEVIRPGMSETEQILALYHYFGTRIDYDYAWLDALNLSDDQYLFPDIVVYDALTTNLGVCHTYSYLMQFGLEQLGIESYCVSGDMVDSDDSHMWIIAKADGAYFQFDVTWDSSSNDGTVGLQYFGMTDEERLAGGLSTGYRVSIDMWLEGLPCTDDRFAGFRDIVDFRAPRGDGTLEVLRENGQWESIDIPCGS